MKQEWKFKQRLAAHPPSEPLKIVIGSSNVFEKDWIPSEAHFLNLLKESDWKRYFSENQIDALLAEHVWEHLTPEEGKKAVNVCHAFLKKGGHLRIAIPDGYHSNKEYIESVKPGGHGAGSDDHKVLYNFQSLSRILKEAGFTTITPLEYFDENHQFHAKEWKKEDGFIHRSIRYDKRNANGSPNYTSLIVDAVK